MDVKDIHVLIKIKVNKFILNSTFVLILFLIDRFSKVYVIELVEKTEISEIYITSFLNSYLVWNTGIAFGLFSLSNELIYNLFTYNFTNYFISLQNKTDHIFYIIFNDFYINILI